MGVGAVPVRVAAASSSGGSGRAGLRYRFGPGGYGGGPILLCSAGCRFRGCAALERRLATRGVWWVCGSFRLPVASGMSLAYTPLIPLSVCAGHVAPVLWLRRLSAAAPWQGFVFSLRSWQVCCGRAAVCGPFRVGYASRTCATGLGCSVAGPVAGSPAGLPTGMGGGWSKIASLSFPRPDTGEYLDVTTTKMRSRSLAPLFVDEIRGISSETSNIVDKLAGNPGGQPSGGPEPATRAPEPRF